MTAQAYTAHTEAAASCTMCTAVSTVLSSSTWHTMAWVSTSTATRRMRSLDVVRGMVYSAMMAPFTLTVERMCTSRVYPPALPTSASNIG